MLDRHGINMRFFECYPNDTYYVLAKRLGVHHSLVYQWKEKLTPVPWYRVKALVDEQGLSWDWIVDGSEPKYRKHRKNEVPQELDRHAINQRFLSLFPGMSQAEIGEELGGINPGTVYKWRHDIAQVPWERLKYAINEKGVSWEWLIEGR